MDIKLPFYFVPYIRLFGKLLILTLAPTPHGHVEERINRWEEECDRELPPAP
jgi:hypothetical protein